MKRGGQKCCFKHGVQGHIENMIFEQRPELWPEAHIYLGRPSQAERTPIESLVCLGNSKEATMAEAKMMKGERDRR